jgi:hypothetical protein
MTSEMIKNNSFYILNESMDIRSIMKDYIIKKKIHSLKESKMLYNKNKAKESVRQQKSIIVILKLLILLVDLIFLMLCFFHLLKEDDLIINELLSICRPENLIRFLILSNENGN